MRYCVRCLQPDTRPQTEFADDGICPACVYFESEKEIDYEERFQELENICERYRSNSPTGFDCILGVSGGKDSTRQALFLREKLNLNPLLVCLSYPPEQITERGAANISNLINLGFDVEIRSPAPQTWRKLMKNGFIEEKNWGLSTEMALFAAVPQAAIEHGVSLIFWGENPALQLGDLGTSGTAYWDGNSLRNMNTLTVALKIFNDFPSSEKQALVPYVYPENQVLQELNIQIVYLGVFWNDWSLVNNGAYSALEGIEIRDDIPQNTGDLYGVTSLDEDWVTLNQMIKYYKYGFGRITDYVNEEIRRARLTREAGIQIVSELDASCSDSYIESFCSYIGISVDEFWKKVRDATNPRLFEVNGGGNRPLPRFEVGLGLVR